MRSHRGTSDSVLKGHLRPCSGDYVVLGIESRPPAYAQLIELSDAMAS